MDLSGCKSLTKVPDISSCPNLERLDLSNCENLVAVHDFVGFLQKLWSFSAFGCCKLGSFPKRFKLRSLQSFSLVSCASVEDFPEIQCENEFLFLLNLSGTSIKELPSSIEDLKGLKSISLRGSSLKKLPSSILPQLEILFAEGCVDQLQSLPRIVKVDGDSQVPIHIGKVEEADGIQSTPSVVSTGEECEIASTSTAELTPTNSSIFNDAGSSSSAIIWKSLRHLCLHFCCLSESNFFTNGNNYFPALVSLDLSGSDIVIFPPQSVKLDRLRRLRLDNCKKLEEILPLPLNIEYVEARECTSLESFALLSEILIKNNGTNFSNFLIIDLYGCHKLLANMWPIPSWEEEQNLAEPLKRERDTGIIFPGKKFPNWFSCRTEAHDCELWVIEIEPPPHCYGILFYVGFRVGIIDPITDDASITVGIHDGSDWKELSTLDMTVPWMDSDHVWMYGKCYRPDKQTVSRFTFKCNSKLVVFRRIGIHFLRLGSKFHYYSSDEEIDSSLDLMYEKRHSSISELDNDDENPKEDLELENDDENLKEIFGKRRRHDEYDCNLELNLYPQQKRQHSSTMGIIITELENDDENL